MVNFAEYKFQNVLEFIEKYKIRASIVKKTCKRFLGFVELDTSVKG